MPSSSLLLINAISVTTATDPAWNFSRRIDHDVMAVQMLRKLTGDLEEMRERSRQTQEMIARWKVAVERLKQPRLRKHHPREWSYVIGYQ